MIFENTPRIETDALILRRFNEKDLGALLKIFGDRETNTYLPWFPAKDIKGAKEFYNVRYAAKYLEKQAYAYAVCLKKDDIPIGYVNLETQGAFDLGYGLLPQYHGRGIVTEACRAVLIRAQSNGFDFVTATHDVNNPKSGAVMQRLGMKYCYSYREQWQPKNISVVFRMYQLNFNKDCPVYEEYKKISREWFKEQFAYENEKEEKSGIAPCRVQPLSAALRNGGSEF